MIPLSSRFRRTISNLVFLAVVFLVATSTARAGWNNPATGSSENLKSVDFPTASIGYATGQNGTILKSIDGGASWVSQSSGSSDLLWQLDFLDASTGYVVGRNGTLLKTTDGGANWNPLNPGTSVNLRDVFFADASNGWIVGSGGVIRNTTDAGANWNPQTSGSTEILTAVAFSDSSTGWVVGQSGTILKTVDGGSNWNSQTVPDPTKDFQGISVLSATTAYVVGSTGAILKTTDGGTNWIAQTSGTIANLWHCYFTNATIGYATGSNPTVILKTVDGGTTWISQDPQTTERLRALYFTDSLTGWAAGDNGTILNTTDGGVGSDISGNVYHDADASGTLDAGEQAIGTVWVKLVQGGSVLQVVQADTDTGAYSLINVADGTYDVFVDDNNNVGDSTPTAPVNWLFGTPATGLLSVTVAGADVTDRDLGLTFNFDLAADCACGYEDGLFTQVSITIDGDMSDWGVVFSDGDNNACDSTDDTDLDHTVQSTGRNLVRTAATWDATYFSMWTQRVGSSNNTQNFVYYADTNADGIQQNGEPVIVAKWQGNTGNVTLELCTYDDLGSGGDPLLDAGGFADGYSMPGDLTVVKTLTMPDGAGQGSTSGATDGTQMEWTVEWTELGVPAGSAIGWHVGSTNSNPAAAGLGAQIDDNLGGCGGQCSGSNQFAGITPTPIGGGGGDTVYSAHTFTNTGNGLDLFDFTWSWTGDFAPVSVTFYRDLGTVGEFDPGIDVLLTDTDADTDPDTGNLGAGASFALLIAIELPVPPTLGNATVTTIATSNFVPGCGGTVTPVVGSVDDPVVIAPRIVKQAFQSDGTPIASGSTLPSGVPVKFLIYIANHGGALTDASLRDVLDPVFAYQTGTMKVDNTLVASVVCPGGACTEATIFAQVDGSGTSLGDGDAITAPVDADAGSYNSGSKTLDLGDSSNANNAQLNVAADSVWALVFTIRTQ